METTKCGISQEIASQGTCERSEEDVHSGDESESGEATSDELMPLNVDIPNTDSLHHIEQNINHQKSKFAHLFKNNEQLEYFLMLPLSKKQRRTLIKQLLEKEQ